MSPRNGAAPRNIFLFQIKDSPRKFIFADLGPTENIFAIFCLFQCDNMPIFEGDDARRLLKEIKLCRQYLSQTRSYRYASCALLLIFTLRFQINVVIFFTPD